MSWRLPDSQAILFFFNDTATTEIYTLSLHDALLIYGEILDAGVGTGRNMPFYPSGATVTGIDLSPGMLARAEERKEVLGVAADLHQMDVTGTELADARFDYIIATFLFCVLDDDDQLPALRELKRICKPDGEIRILEYEYSKSPWTRFVMHLWAPWVRVMYGATFDRHTERHVADAGLELIEERFVFKVIAHLGCPSAGGTEGILCRFDV